MRLSSSILLFSASIAHVALANVVAPLLGRDLDFANYAVDKRGHHPPTTPTPTPTCTPPAEPTHGHGHGHGHSPGHNYCDKGNLLNLGLDLDLDLLSSIFADLDLCLEVSLGGNKGLIADILLDLSVIIDLGGKIKDGADPIPGHCGCTPANPPNGGDPSSACLHKILIKLNAVLGEIDKLGSNGKLSLKGLTKAADELVDQLLECLGLGSLSPEVDGVLNGVVSLVGDLIVKLDLLTGNIGSCGCSSDGKLLDGVAALLHGLLGGGKDGKSGLLGLGLLGLRADPVSDIVGQVTSILDYNKQITSALQKTKTGCGCSSNDPIGSLLGEILDLWVKIQIDIKIALKGLDIDKCKSVLDLLVILIAKLNLLCTLDGVLGVVIDIVKGVILPLCGKLVISINIIIKTLGSCGCGKDAGLLAIIAKLLLGIAL